MEKNHEKNIPFYISLLILGGTLLYIIAVWITRGGVIDNYFVADTYDTSMDYFNMLANMSHDDPYYANANYPAMCFFILKVLYRFISGLVPEVQNGGFWLRTFMPAQLTYIGLMLVCTLVIWELLRYFSREMGWKSILFSTSIVLCGPMLFLYERGNLLIISLLFTLLFLACYNSDKFWIRLVSYFALAMAAAIKLYPAVFGLLVLRKKRVKETLLLTAVGILVFAVPFFAFGGFEAIQNMLTGITTSVEIQTGLGLGQNYSADNLYKIIGMLCGKSIDSTPTWFTALLAGLCVAVFLTSREEWKQLLSMSLLCIWVPTFSYTYSLVFMILPLISILFRNNSRRSGKSVLYTLAICCTLIPYFLPSLPQDVEYKFLLTYGTLFVNFILLSLGIAALSDNVVAKLIRK